MQAKYLLLFLSVFLLLSLGCAKLSSSGGEMPQISYGDDEMRSTITVSLSRKNAEKAKLVEVYCFRSHVFLIGEADNEFRAYATGVANGIKGVKGVTPHWFDTGTGKRMRDASLAADIEGKLLFDKNLSATRMAVSVVGGHVVLCGIMADKKSIDTVIAIARDVSGVRSVTSYLVY